MLLGAGAVALGLVGCGSGGGSSKGSSGLNGKDADSMSDFAVGTAFRASKPLTITTLYDDNPNYELNKNWLFFQELTKRTNVTLNPTAVPLSDYENKRSVIIGAGDAPTLIPKTYPGEEVPFAASGAVLPVSDYTRYMPNYTATVKKWNLQADIDTLIQDDGHYYLLPGLHQDVWVDYSLAIRTDILKKLNLQVPQTWDDLYNVLKAMKEAYPDQYPMTDRWGIPTPGGNLFNLLAQAYGTQAGWGYQNATWDADQKHFVFTGAMDQYRDMLTYVNKLVKEKLLDPESFTQQDTDAEAKFTSGKSFVISTNAQELVNTYRTPLSKAVPGATITKIPVPMGPLGAVKKGSRLENGLMISKSAANNPDFLAILQFIDWLFYSDEGKLFAKWGVKGVTYTAYGDGKVTLAKDVDWSGLNPGAPKSLQKDYGFFNGNFVYGGSTELLDSQFTAEELEFQKVMAARKTLPVDPPHPMTQAEQQQTNIWDTPLKDYVTQQTLKFALGTRPLSEWDQFVSECKSKNSDQYIKVVNQAYQRWASKQK